MRGMILKSLWLRLKLRQHHYLELLPKNGYSEDEA